jgi:hypothetical protein
MTTIIRVSVVDGVTDDTRPSIFDVDVVPRIGEKVGIHRQLTDLGSADPLLRVADVRHYLGSGAAEVHVILSARE